MKGIFATKYKVNSLLGTGGMSEVYLAQNIKTGTNVAIKILDKKLSRDEEYIKRFQREIEISKTLNHHNVVKIISYGKDKSRYYIVYEYIQGLTLDKYIKSKKLSLKEIKDITIQILQGLSYAHSKGIIHRDIKPSNIMVSKNGKVKILDFGIARATTKSSITKTGMFMGSPHYTSPEQIESKKVDQRTDIYSLGIVLYEMVEGKVPFQADTPLGFMRAHLDKPVPRIKRNVPSYLSSIVYKCLAKNPKDRFSTTKEMAGAITSKSYIEDTRIILTKKESKAKVFSIIGSVAVFIVMIVVVIVVFRNISKKEATEAIAEGGTIEENIEGKEESEDFLIIRDIIVSSEKIETGDQIDLSIDIENDITDLIIEWKSKDGIFSHNNSVDTKWIAPYLPGEYIITVIVTNDIGLTDSEKINIVVTKKLVELEFDFINEVYNLLDEYEIVFEEMYLIHGEDIWYIDDPQEISLEETFPPKLERLTDKLKGFSYPESYTNDRNNLIRVADELLFYQIATINCMKNNDYDGYLNSCEKFDNIIDDIYKYYNKMSDDYNEKYGFD